MLEETQAGPENEPVAGNETLVNYEPKTLAERVCRTLEGMYLLDMHEADPQKFADDVYMFCHLVPGTCIKHEDWMKRFEALEEEVRRAMRSPAEKAKDDERDTKDVPGSSQEGIS